MSGICDELKPCPFCGCEDIDEYEGDFGNGVYCMNCGAMMGEPIHMEFRTNERVSYEQAIEAWNTRATLGEQRGTVDIDELLDEFEHECFMIRIEASETMAKDDVVRKAYKRQREETARAITATLGGEINGDTSDGYHTFNELYHHRAVLFSVVVANHRGIAWKSKMHHDGTMYDGMFIVGLDTPWGQASYHYDIDPYWDMFDCEERESAPEWDGHTPDDAIERIGKLAALDGGECEDTNERFNAWTCSECKATLLLMFDDFDEPTYSVDGVADVPRFCPNCGKAVRR